MRLGQDLADPRFGAVTPRGKLALILSASLQERPDVLLQQIERFNGHNRKSLP